MKKIFSILFCLLALHAMADNRLYINDFSINPDETVDVSIMLDNEVTDFASFQADMYLPEGLELVEQYNEEDDEYFTFSLTTRARSRMAIGSAAQADGAVRLMLTQTMGSSVQTIKDASGALVNFQLKAAANANGTKYIDLKNIVFSTATSVRYPLDNTQTTVTVNGTTPVTGISLNNTTLTLTAAGQMATLTATVTPSNATNKNVTWTSSNTAVATVSNTGVVTAVANGTAVITATTADGTNLSAQCTVTVSISATTNIIFADANVKAICVANWDTDGDGELSYDEAAAVKGLGQVFKDNTDIVSFDELQYFTGLMEIADFAFEHCSALISIIIPEGLERLGFRAFSECTSLLSVVFPNSLKVIDEYAFDQCRELSSINIPSGVTVGLAAFAACYSLATVTLNCSNIHETAFDFSDSIITAYINCILPISPTRLFRQSNIVYGENGGYAYADMDMDYLNTDDNIIDKDFLANTENYLITIPIYLRNNVDISQIQFDLRIAPDFSLAENPNGRKMIEMDKTRFDYDEDFGYSHTMTLTEFGEGHYRIVLTSPENTPLKASDDDAFLYVTLHLNEGIKEGDINMLSIEGIEFSTPSADKIRPGNIGKNVKVYLREPGDFNHDNVVSVTDYAGVVKWVAGQGYDDQGVPEWVIKKASDVNEDGDISVTDVSGIANIILYGNYTGHASNVKARRMAKKQGASLSIEPFSISPDETKEITVNLSSSDAELSQCQFDITLPEGMSVASVNGRPALYPGSIIRTADGFSHAVSCALREDGTVRVVCLSGSNDAYNRTEGCLVRMKVIADKDIAAGSADIEISNVEFARTDASKVWGAGGIASVTIGHETDGISSIADSSASLKEIYSADGTRKNRLTKGMNIIRHTDGSVQKVMVK